MVRDIHAGTAVAGIASITIAPTSISPQFSMVGIYRRELCRLGTNLFAWEN